MGNIAYMLENGLGIKKDKKKTKEWREKQANTKKP
jgi:TPR repeat protein